MGFGYIYPNYQCKYILECIYILTRLCTLQSHLYLDWQKEGKNGTWNENGSLEKDKFATVGGLRGDGVRKVLISLLAGLTY